MLIFRGVIVGILHVSDGLNQPMVNCWFGALCFGFLGSPKVKGIVMKRYCQNAEPPTHYLPLVDQVDTKKTSANNKWNDGRGGNSELLLNLCFSKKGGVIL